MPASPLPTPAGGDSWGHQLNEAILSRSTPEYIEENLPARLTPTELSATFADRASVDRSHNLTDATLSRAARATQVTIPTYDGSGVAVHPSVYFNPSGWNGYKYWMGMTPYPSGNSALENPSIVASHDGNTWVVPAGLTNPVEPDPGAPVYNSDPYVTVDNTGRMWLFYRRTGDGNDTLLAKTSTNGVNWGAPQTVIQYAASVRRLVAPSIWQRADGSWVMYAVDTVPSTRVILRYTATNPTGPWSNPATVTISGNAGTPWHLDAHEVGGETHLMIQDGGSVGGDIWAAVSQDGVNFTAGPAFMAKYAGAWDELYYKSCFVPAVRNGVAGWDAWIGSVKWSSGVPIVGRTFVSFDTQATNLAAQAMAQSTGELMAARANIHPWLVGDSFSRADAPTLTSAESGQGWTALTTPRLRILDKAASPDVNGNTNQVIESGSVDHWPSVRIDAVPNLVQHWVVARSVDASNRYRLGFPTGGVLTLQKVVAATATTLLTIPWRRGTTPGITIGLRCTGTTLRVYVDGILEGEVVDSANTTGTQVGLQATDTRAKFRYFKARAA